MLRKMLAAVSKKLILKYLFNTDFFRVFLFVLILIVSFDTINYFKFTR